jgi:hypothetical protein
MRAAAARVGFASDQRIARVLIGEQARVAQCINSAEMMFIDHAAAIIPEAGSNALPLLTGPRRDQEHERH